MTFFYSSPTESQPQRGNDPYSGQRHGPTFRNGGDARWNDATVGIIGGGALGGRVAVEAVRSGVGAVYLWDFDTGSPENLANQLVRAGEPKVHSLARACDEIRPGVMRGFPHDIRHAGTRRWTQCDVMIDCSDAPALAWPLTECSNGTATPLIRSAVDGRGQWELGRALASHGAGGHACQMCTRAISEFQHALPRTPCPGQLAPRRPPTNAGNAISLMVAGLALLQAQRIVTGNDLERVLDREVIIDLSHSQLLDIQLQRCAQCLSGHRTWQPIDVGAAAHDTTLQELFGLAENLFHTQDVTLAAYQHAFNTQAFCDCGLVRLAVGTDWAQPPPCQRCGTTMSWLREMQIDRVDQRVASDLGILRKPLDQLGVPTDGAMFLARSPGQTLKRLLLRGSQVICNHAICNQVICNQAGRAREPGRKQLAASAERKETE